MNNTGFRILTGLAVAGVIAGVAAATWRNDDTASAPGQASNDSLLLTEGLAIENRSLAEVVGRSEDIVEGVYLDEREEFVPGVRATDASGGRVARIDVVRRFRLERVYRGSFKVGEVIDVRATLKVELPAIDPIPATTLRYERVQIDKGSRYLLFMLSGTDGPGARSLALAFEPAIARVDGDALTFLVSDEFVKQQRAAGTLQGTERTSSAFRGLRLTDIERAVVASPFLRE